MPVVPASEIQNWVGKEVGVSEWKTIDQERINVFADVTEDHQFIHIDPEAAAKTPFGGTIAHGFLTLSMLSALGAGTSIRLENVAMGVNYGFEKVRFMQPVPAGKNIRGRFVLKDVKERNPGQFQLTYEVTVEIEGVEKPALIAEWLTLQYVQ
ncbi:MAG: MaoC family dehydratase [Pseudomonadota bacterium]